MGLPNGQRSKSGTPTRSVASATDRARTLRQAKRHSTFVRLLKFVLPVLALLMMGAYGAFVLTVNKLKKAGLDVGTVTIDPTNLTMENPKYDGFGTDGSHYVIRAKSAVTDLRQTGPVKLTTIDGDITQLNGVITHLKAVWGTYDQKKDLLELYEKIDIDGSTGMKARLTRATVYNKESRIISPEPVYAETDTGNIRSNSMTMNSKARRSTFLDDVHVQLKANPKPEDATGVAKAKATAAVMPGLAANSGQPIEVKSEQLDVDDGAKTALFRRNVIAKQGDAILQAPELDVFYEGKADIAGAPAQKPDKKTDAASSEPGAPTPATPPEQQTKLKLIKARGGVVMTNKDDKATSETLDYDAQTDRAVLKGNVVMTSLNERQATASEAHLDQKADTVLLTGDVVVIQGKNTMKSRRLFVDRKKGTTRLESPAQAGISAGRITTVFYQNAAQNSAKPGGKPGEPGKAAAKASEAANADLTSAFAFKSDPSQPIEIEAESLDVLDQKHNAIYKGNVIAKQGAFIIHTSHMTAYYTGQAGIASAGAAPKAATKGGAGKSDEATQLTKVEARGKVVVHGRDNATATGDEADYDAKGNTIVMRGKVIVSQVVGGKTNVVQGPEGSKLYIDMNTGEYKFDAFTVIEPVAKGTNAGQPMLSASPAVSGPAATSGAGSACAADSGLICKTGRMRLVLYPKPKADTKGKAKPGEVKPAENTAEAAPSEAQKKPARSPAKSSAWEPTTSTTSTTPGASGKQ